MQRLSKESLDKIWEISRECILSSTSDDEIAMEIADEIKESVCFEFNNEMTDEKRKQYMHR